MRFCASAAAGKKKRKKKKKKHHCRQGGTTSQHCHVSVCEWPLSVSTENGMDACVIFFVCFFFLLLFAETSHSYRSVSILHVMHVKAIFVCDGVWVGRWGGSWWVGCFIQFAKLWFHFDTVIQKKLKIKNKKSLPALCDVAFWLFSHWADSYIRAQRRPSPRTCTESDIC